VGRILLATLVLISLAPFASAQTTRPATTRPLPSGAGPSASGVEVKIMSAKMEFLALKKHSADNTTEDMIANDSLLVIRLQILNNGKKEITYQTFNGAGGQNDRASLLDSNKKFSAIANFGDLEVVGTTKTATLKPGESVNDVLAFAPPANGAKPVLLYLPAKNHGDNGLWKLEVKMEEAEAK